MRENCDLVIPFNILTPVCARPVILDCTTHLDYEQSIEKNWSEKKWKKWWEKKQNRLSPKNELILLLHG